jgi:hypothetical protein
MGINWETYWGYQWLANPFSSWEVMDRDADCAMAPSGGSAMFFVVNWTSQGRDITKQGLCKGYPLVNDGKRLLNELENHHAING